MTNPTSRMQKRKRKYPPVLLGLLAVSVFAPVNILPDDLKTSPLAHISASHAIQEREKRKRQVLHPGHFLSVYFFIDF
jgi:hypothetical protein